MCVKNKNKYKPFLRMLASFGMLMLSLVLMVGMVFAWFLTSKTPQTGFRLTTVGCDVSVSLKQDDGLWVGFDGQSIHCTFDNFFCGQSNSRQLSLQCVNNANTAVLITWLFFAPEHARLEEVPYVDENGSYYYLGSQLMVSDISAQIGGQAVDISSAAVGKSSYLVVTSSEGVEQGQVNFVDAPLDDFSQLTLIDDLSLPAFESIIITLSFTFVDNLTDQSIYQSPFLGACKRRLGLQLKEAM